MLTKAQLLNTSSDEANTERARQCANPWKWQQLEGNERAIWGEFKTPYEPFLVAVDLNGPGFKCTCPSRKFPCKHALALGILLFENNGLFKVGHNIPESIEKWLNGRDQRSQKSKTTNSPTTTQVKEEPTSPTVEWDALTITTQGRIDEMQQGLEELKLWLEDLIRQGIASLESQGAERLLNISTRMVDAKLGSIGRRLRGLVSLLGQENWHEEVITTIGELWLLINGIQKIESLPPMFQTEMLNLAGVNIKKDLLLTREETWDVWQVVGVVLGQEEQLNYRRTWLMGENSGETALLLDFAFGGQSFETFWNVGEFFEGALIFYPSIFPQRAILKSKEGVPTVEPQLNGFATLEIFSSAITNGFAQNPWLTIFPAYFDNVVPVFFDDSWWLADSTERALPLQVDNLMGWEIMAQSLGHPLSLFGEWRDGKLFPLSWNQKKL